MLLFLFRCVAVGLLLLRCATCCTHEILTQADLDRGVVPQPGDSVVLRAFSKLTPRDALSATSQRGKWWLRRYRETSNGQEHVMLMTVERDMNQPELCIVPRVTYPLALDGWYEVWVGTYRGPYGGGVDVKLTDDDCFLHIDPQAVALHSGRPKPRTGAIVEINFKPAVDLTGQSLQFQQPYGTYESFHWGFCESALAYVRLVRLTDEQVAAFKADQIREDRRIIAFDDDNFSRYWMWGGESDEKVQRIFEPLRYSDVLFFGLCLGASTDVKVPTPYSDMYTNRGARLGDKRMRTMYVDFTKRGTDVLELATNRAHRYGIKLLPTLRMSSTGHGSGSRPHYQSLSQQYRLKTCGRLDFAYPQVREHYVSLVRYILENYDVDGFILDFTRHCVYFNADEPDKVKHMNAFSAAMREMVDAVSEAKHKELWLAASFSESSYVSGFLKHYLKVDASLDERLAYQGIDVAGWVNQGFYDIILPEGPRIEKYIEMTRGTGTRCFPRWEFHSTPYGRRVGSGIHDPTPAEDKQDRPVNPHNGPQDFEAGWLKLHEAGADGLYLFNNPLRAAPLRRMGHLDELRGRVTSGSVNGTLEGPLIEFRD